MSGPTRGAAQPVVALDLVPLHPGHGGAGGGIWRYAEQLVRALDDIAPSDLEIVCLAHAALPLETTAVRVVRIPVDTRGAAQRMRWIHGTLPTWCARHGVRVLHKLATEVPAVLPRTRLVTTVHDFMAEFRLADAQSRAAARDRLRLAYFARAARLCFARSDRIIAVSETIAAEARGRHPRAADRIVAVPQGVVPPLPTFHRATADVFTGRLLYVGMFSPHKGQLHAVRALAALQRSSPQLVRDITLGFRGAVQDAAHHARVRAAIAEARLDDRVRFDPYQPDAATSAIYAAADALLLLSEYEGFGLPLLEAQAHGVPVICSDLPVFREVLGDSACFAPPRDAEAVAAAIRRVATDAGYRATLVRRGDANVRRFSWARTAQATLDVYRALR